MTNSQSSWQSLRVALILLVERAAAGMTPGKELKELKEPTQNPRSTLVVPSQEKWQPTDKFTELALSLEPGVPLRSTAWLHPVLDLNERSW
jgi:hypothetical protein